jgi:type IV pilus assembly protein PilY1
MQVKNLLKNLSINFTCWHMFASVVVSVASFGAASQTIDFAQAPLLTLKPAPALVMLTMGRDLPLYKAAYNDVNDIDGDGIPDLFFKPAFKYEGYFSYDRCYDYDAGNSLFKPVSAKANPVVVDIDDDSKTYYKCSGKWSGNFLNWVTMARIDVLRKVLYGGKRIVDEAKSSSTSGTVLERTYVPQDSTLWGKEYSVTDGYDIAEYTPLPAPKAGTRHMFANTTLQGDVKRFETKTNPPLMIVYAHRAGRIWDLISQNALILGKNPATDNNALQNGNPITQYIVRVETCKKISGIYEAWCKGYPSSKPTSYKPTGLLHKYGENKTLAFGLLSGTYDANYAGGVLRQNIDDFNQEIDSTTGIYTSVKGVVHHLSAFRPWGFGPDINGNAYNQWENVNYAGIPNIGTTRMWGNPLGEMMFETLNYFSGGSPSEAFTTGVGTLANSPETPLGLQKPDWINPFAASNKRKNSDAYPKCSRPVQMTIGDPKTSFDSDQVPGTAFSITSGFGENKIPSLGTLNVSDQASLIWASEFGSGTRKFFIGESTGDTGNDSRADGNPSAKLASSFKNIRGHGPDSTTNQGSFYGASVARFGKYEDLENKALPVGTKLRVDQISIALDSHIPQIKIPVNGKIVSIVPFSKSVHNVGIINDADKYQQTGAITTFFVEQLANLPGMSVDNNINSGRPLYKFLVSYSDTDQGGDNELDAKVRYEIKVSSANELTVGMDYYEGFNGIEMHQGYVISGTNVAQDGLYLDVGGWSAQGVPPPALYGYYLDTLPGKLPGSAMTIPKANGSLPTKPAYLDIEGRVPVTTLSAPRKFTIAPAIAGDNTTTGYVPHDMLWYAAKYGGASVNTATGVVDFKLKPNGDPENYYFANNPSALTEQMGQAFQKAASLAVASSSAVAASGAKVQGGNFVYQAGFESAKWSGELRAFKVQPDGNISNTPTWLATAKQPDPATRTMVLGQGGTDKLALTTNGYTNLTATEKTSFGNSDDKYNYLLGERSKEQPTGSLRSRNSAIGDIVNSDPLYIGKADFGYIDTSYDTFKAASEPKLVAFGSNDGAYRLVDGTTGVEKLAFFPQATSKELYKLADPNYTHQYFVDGPSSFGHVRNGSTAAWNTVVAASAGAGGKSMFALNASATNFATNGVLWEVNDSTVQNGSDYGIRMGNIINKPMVGQLPTNVGAVFSGNGVNSTEGKATLMVVNAITGKVIRACTPNNAANTTDNGMTSLASVSVGQNGKIDYIYGADYKGNIWRMEPDSANCSSAAVKIFTAKDNNGNTQAITGELTVISAPNGMAGNMLVFGTGKYATAADVSNTDPQSLYGVWDDLSTTKNVARTDLVNFPIGTKSSKNTRMTAKAADVNGGKAWFEASITGAPSTKKGWVIDLACVGCPSGERFVDKPVLAGNDTNPAMYFLSYVPSTDPCKVGGGAWITGVNPYTGAYTKAYSTIADNSAFVNGAAPRGLFIVKSDATSTTKSSEYLYVLTNEPDNNPDSPFGVVKGGTTKGSDGSGTGGLGAEITPPTPPAAAIRRQVWRQIQ